MRATIFGLATALLLGLAGSADASDYGRSGVRGHYDWHPGHFDRHGDHYHYHPGHFDYHRGRHVTPIYPQYGSGSYYGSGYVRPGISSYDSGYSYPGSSYPGSYSTYSGYGQPSWCR